MLSLDLNGYVNKDALSSRTTLVLRLRLTFFVILVTLFDWVGVGSFKSPLSRVLVFDFPCFSHLAPLVKFTDEPVGVDNDSVDLTFKPGPVRQRGV